MSAANGGISIISFLSVIEAPVVIASASFSSIFSLTTGIIKKSLKITRNKKKKNNKNVMLAKSKLDSIETLISQTLIALEISHEEFQTIVNEEENYKRLKESIRMIKSSHELNKKEWKEVKIRKLWVKIMKMQRIKKYIF